jgi:serine/threonine protein kinase
MILEKGHNVKLDIWNLGIVIYEIFTGKTPFHVSKHEKGNLDSLQKKILQ